MELMHPAQKEQTLGADDDTKTESVHLLTKGEQLRASSSCSESGDSLQKQEDDFN